MKSSSHRLVIVAFGLLLSALCVAAVLLIDRTPEAQRGVAMMLSSAVLVALCAFVAWATGRRIIHPIRRVTLIGRHISNGNIGVGFDADTAGEAAELQSVFKAIADNMFTVVSEVRNGTGAIATAAGQISREHDALSARTRTQSESLQTTAASMEELTSTVSHNAENADEANRLARSASEFAEEGGKIMALVVDNMNSIKASSSRIADIIGVIDGIAFQTNILALNAAVEAARAGEQGRGFSVVAAEVRSLAQRSAEAAREVKRLIDDSVQKVGAGNKLVEQAGQSMEKIVTSITQVNNLMGEIAVSSAQQRIGIEQVNDAISQIEGFTQKNSSLVEGAIDAANRLQEKALWLTSTVSAFDLGAREFGSREEAIALVGTVVAELSRGDVAPILARINDGDPRFRDRDLYIVAIDRRNNTLVASGATPQLVGHDILGLKDSDGKYFAKEVVALAARQKNGWVDYKFEHPVTRRILQKSTYVEAAGDLIIQCGIYKNQGTPALQLV
jgi:methyl-accepting chemotaxis protein